jgi:hypothetical protein
LKLPEIIQGSVVYKPSPVVFRKKNAASVLNRRRPDKVKVEVKTRVSLMDLKINESPELTENGDSPLPSVKIKISSQQRPSPKPT